MNMKMAEDQLIPIHVHCDDNIFNVKDDLSNQVELELQSEQHFGSRKNDVYNIDTNFLGNLEEMSSLSSEDTSPRLQICEDESVNDSPEKQPIKLPPFEDISPTKRNLFAPTLKSQIHEEQIATTSNTSDLLPTEDGEIEQNYFFEKKKRSKKKSLLCDKCPYVTTIKSNLRRHIKSVHENLRSYACTHCTYRAKTQENLGKHLASVHAQNCTQYKCPFCLYQVPRKETLNRHVRLRHPQPNLEIKCKFCNLSFTKKRALQAHIKIQHKDEILPQFFCELCEFRTWKKSLLNCHIIEKHTENKFVCDFCGFATRWKTHLMRHIRSKHDICTTKYKCDYCGVLVSRQDSLTRHIQIKHTTKNTTQLMSKVQQPFAEPHSSSSI